MMVQRILWVWYEQSVNSAHYECSKNDRFHGTQEIKMLVRKDSGNKYTAQ